MKKIAAHFQYNFPLYIAVLLVFSLIWCTVFSSLSKPKPEEKITISYFGEKLSTAELKAELAERMSRITEQNIKETSVNLIPKTGDVFSAPMIEAKTLTSDIVILSLDYFTDTVIKNNFAALSESAAEMLKNELGSSVEYHSIDGSVYGVILTYPDISNNLTKYYSGESRLLAVPSQSSVNFGNLFGNSAEENTAAISVLKYLLTEVSE